MEAHRSLRFMAVCGFVACLMGRYRGDEHGKVSQGAFLDCSWCAILTGSRLAAPPPFPGGDTAFSLPYLEIKGKAAE